MAGLGGMREQARGPGGRTGNPDRRGSSQVRAAASTRPRASIACHGGRTSRPPDIASALAWNFQRKALASDRALLEQDVDLSFPPEYGSRLKMEILVTGATGFVGTGLSTYLESLGHKVVRLGSRDCDLTNADSLRRFEEHRYDQIYHLAAWTQAGDFCLYHPGEQWIINQQINTNVLAWWQRHQPQAKLIAMGTSCAYPCDRELVEDNYLEGQPIESLFSYGMTKRMLYAGLKVLNKQYGLRYLYLVPSTLYGPGYHTDGRQMHFIFDVIRKILLAQRNGTPVVLWGDGHQRREIVHLDDFVRVAVRLAETVDDLMINVGAGEELSIREFARIVCELTGYDFERIQFDTTRYVGARSKSLSVTKLRELMPDLSLTPLRQGLDQMIQWFEDHLDEFNEPPSSVAA